MTDAFLSGPFAGAKWAFTTRRVRRADCAGLGPDLAAARPGDLILARIERIGSHKRLQLACGGYGDLWEGDRVVVACGDRYAVDQFEGRGEIAAEDCHLLAGGGVAGRLECRHARMTAPTRLAPLGRVLDAAGRAVSLADHARARGPGGRPAAVIGVGGTGMTAGKTTAAAALIRGLTVAGFRVAGLKATGTGAFGDVRAYAAAGARYAADFTEDGPASTHRQPAPRVRAALDALLGHAAAEGCEVAVVEIADGLLQPETAALFGDPEASARFDGVVFACGDALSAVGGLAWLALHGIRPLAVSGVLTRAPLAVREARAASEVWILDRDDLADPAAATALLSEARNGGPAPAVADAA